MRIQDRTVSRYPAFRPETNASSRGASATRWAAVAAVALGLAVPAMARTRVYYFPAQGAHREASGCGPGHPLAAPRLRGLDLARVAVGLPGCAPAPAGLSSLADRVDALILIDDSNGLRPDLANDLRPPLRAGATVAAGTFLGLTRDRRHVVRSLIVGVREYLEMGSDDRWMQHIRRIAATLDAGRSEATEPEVHEFGVPYSRDGAVFQRAVEDQLCPLMECGSDDRRHMRELIAGRDELAETHRRAAGLREGQTVRVRAMLYRQRDRADRIIDIHFEPAGEVVDMPEEPIHGRPLGPPPGDLHRALEAGIRVLRGRTGDRSEAMLCALEMLSSNPNAADRYYTAEDVNAANRINRIEQSHRLRRDVADLDPERVEARTEVPSGRRTEHRRTDEELRRALLELSWALERGVGQVTSYIGSHAGVTATSVQAINNEILAGRRDPSNIYYCWGDGASR